MITQQLLLLLRNKGLSPTSLGAIYSASSWADTSNFTNQGSTVSVVSNALQFAGGTGIFTQSLAYNYYTSLERWAMVGTIKVGTKNSTSFGFGFGVKSVNSTFGASNQYHIVGRFSMTTGIASDGQLIINGGSANTEVTNSGATRLSFSVNDFLELTVTREFHTITASIRNTTTGSSAVSCSYTFTTYPNASPYLQNTGRFSIYSFGGTFTVQSLVIRSPERKNARIVLIGDSKTVGYDATLQSTRFADILKATYGSNNVVVVAGGSDGLAEHILKIPELLSLTPTQFVVCGVSNDIRVPRSSAAINADISTLDAALSATGIRVVWTTGLKETMSQSAQQTYINATFPTSRVIDTLGTTLTLDTDNVHPINAGHTTYAGLITSSGKV
jgi:hypothetical protein